MKVLATEIQGADAEYLSSLSPDAEFVFFDETLDRYTDDRQRFDAISVMVHSEVDRDAILSFPNLKLILARSTGFDNIDLREAASRGVVVCNVPAYGSNTVAEHTFALILMLARRTHQAYERTMKGQFFLEGLMGTDISGKTLGVIGAGKIGQHVIRIARGFGMSVIAFDPFPDLNVSDLLSFGYVSLEELYGQSDVIAVCCPLNESTKHLLNRDAFAKMKRGVILVNTARGAVIDTEALLWALEEGIVGGAGLDVLEGETMMDEDSLMSGLTGRSEQDLRQVAENLILMRHPNVVVTPHMAFYSREALNRILEMTAENLNAFMSGEPKNTVS